MTKKGSGECSRLFSNIKPLVHACRLLEAQKAENNNAWPETVAVVLWGTDNIKTYGESLAQVMMMVGVNPVADALGRVNKLEVSFLSKIALEVLSHFRPKEAWQTLPCLK